MSTQVFTLSAKGVAFGSTSIAATLMENGAVHTFEKQSLYELGAGHSVAVVHAGDNEINNLPVDMIIRDWIRSLETSFPRVEDYVASFINHVEDADLRMFPSDGEAGWQGRSLLWLLESSGFEIINELISNNDELMSLVNEHSKRSEILQLQKIHDLSLALLDAEIAKRYVGAKYYNSFPLYEAVEFFKEDLRTNGYRNSKISFLGQGFENVLTDFESNPGQMTQMLELSDEFINSLMNLAALLICSRNDDSNQGAILTFIGYGSNQTMPVSTTIVVDGVIISAQYYSVDVDGDCAWAGESLYESEPWNHEPIEPLGGSYPLWVNTPTTNRPLVMFQFGGAGLLYTWLRGYSVEYMSERETELSELASSFRDQYPEDESNWIGRIMTAAEPKNEFNRQNTFNSLASRISLESQAKLVESFLRLETYNSLFDDSSHSWPTIGGPVEVSIIRLGHSIQRVVDQ